MSGEKSSLSDAAEKMGKLSLSSIPLQKELECPFTWPEWSEKFDEFDWLEFVKKKLSRADSNDWRKFSFKILLVFIYSNENNEEESEKTLQECKKHLEEMVDNIFFKDILKGLQHIISACTFHMNDKFGKKEMAESILRKITSFTDLDNICQAAVWAVKAYLLCERGSNGLIEALKFCQLATKLDPDEDGRRRGAWYYLTGKIHFRLRRVSAFETMPTTKELSLLERSILRNPFPVHFVILADSYRETSKCLRKESFSRNKFEADTMCMKSKMMYEKAIALEESVSVLKRCGNGLMKLPRRFQNLPMAQKALEKALLIAPNNPHALLGMGNFFAWNTIDYDKALHYFQEAYAAGIHYAGQNVIMMKYKLNKEYNPLADCEQFISDLKNYMDSKNKDEWVAAYRATKVEYLLLVKKDLLAAAQEWDVVLESVPSATHLKCHWLFTDPDRKINMYQVMINKLEEAFEHNRLSADKEEYLINVLTKTKARKTSD